jgi:hypothetical protein
MNNFFKKEVLDEIIKNESDPIKIPNFLNNSEVIELLNFRNNAIKRMVDREESTKVSFNWGDNEIFKKLKLKIEKITGSFEVNDFEPHFITTRFPLRLHADTGKDPNDIIFKNIVVPLEVNYKDKNLKNKSHTLIFKNKWYEQSALFTTKTKDNYDFIIKNHKGNFIDIINIHDFNEKVKTAKNEMILSYKGNDFLINEKFKDYIKMLSGTKRYNLRTDKHIKKDQKMDKLIYERYMTHQPYEDCDGLELDVALSWEPGALLVWDRIRIHSSDNFLINGIDNKTCIALFTSK